MNILEEAQKLAHGPRQETYGTPASNHGCTAGLFTEYLSRRYNDSPFDGFELDAQDVCIFNILQKVSRLANAYHRDALVDIAGYAANIEMLNPAEPEPGEATWVPLERIGAGKECGGGCAGD